MQAYSKQGKGFITLFLLFLFDLKQQRIMKNLHILKKV